MQVVVLRGVNYHLFVAVTIVELFVVVNQNISVVYGIFVACLYLWRSILSFRIIFFNEMRMLSLWLDFPSCSASYVEKALNVSCVEKALSVPCSSSFFFSFNFFCGVRVILDEFVSLNIASPGDFAVCRNTIIQ